MDSVWHRAVMVQPGRVLGIRLRPFSSWHALVLSALNNAYASQRKPTAADLAQAVCVCRDGFSNQCRSLLAFANTRRAYATMMLRCLAYGTRLGDFRFAQYLDHYTAGPEFWTAENRKESKVQWQFRLPALLMSEYGLSEREAWDMPITRGLCYRAVSAEREGSDLVGDDIRKADEALRKAESKLRVV